MDFSLLAITLILIVFDLVSGFAKAVYQKNVNSEKMREGLWHKSGLIGLIALAYIVQIASEHAELGFDVPTVLAICIFIIITEITSTFENLCILNPHIANSPLGKIFKNTPKDEEAEKLEESNNADDIKEGTNAA